MDESDQKMLNTMLDIIEYEAKEIKTKTDEVVEFLNVLKSEEIDLEAMSFVMKFIRNRYKFVHDLFESIEGIRITKNVGESYLQFKDVLEENLRCNKIYNEEVNQAIAKSSIKH